ncbi:MAG: peptidoglycan DD-metalloendopeptidase family protein [Proteobacteria bacterium]|nr:peptidoglycan DD-metalloendopeptidase family protein [Pseudomonadota bacterium]
MTSRAALLLLTAFVLPLVGWQALGQGAPYASSAEAGNALRDAARALAEARTRAERLEQQAHRATADADRTAAQAAATAARIQQSEAEIRVAQEQAAVVARQRDALRLRMAERQEPVVRLTAALELMARRPLAFSLMRTQSVSETVHLRAVLETMLPEVHRRTTALREEIQRGRALQDAARAAADRLRAGEAALGRRRSELAALESRQRIASRAAQGIAAREADRALALAEQTRDLSALVGQLEADGALREKLAALPGPVQRPARPGDVLVADAIAPTASPQSRFAWVPPVGGRVVTGFGEARPGGASRGLTFAPPPGAQVVAPAAGRVAFAGPYRGFGRIVILEHEGGWSSLVTDLGQLDVAVGDRVLQGSPLGSAGAGRATVTVELRKDGQPVNPLTLPRG